MVAQPYPSHARARLKFVALVVTAVALALFAWWVGEFFERVPVEEKVGLRGPAKYDRLLAARRLFEQLGAPARFMPYRQGLPPENGTLVLWSSGTVVDESRYREVLEWIMRGGHALLVADDDVGDHLLASALGIDSRRRPKADKTIVAGAGDERMTASFLTSRVLKLVANETDYRFGDRVAGYRWGGGRITVLAEDGFFSNQGIGKADNAALFWQLTHFERDGPVWFVTRGDTRGVWLSLWLRLWPLAVAVVVIAAGLLWSRGRRFGPLVTAGGEAAPQLLEHVAASGEFWWRSGAGASLLEALRESVLRTIEHRRPGWLAAGEREQQIARLCGLRPADVEAAFDDTDHRDRRAFVRTVVALEEIRKRL